MINALIANGLMVAIALIAGLILGCLYFGGLWLTVRQLPMTKRPFLLFFMSLLMRLAIALVGFYLIITHFVKGKLIIVLLTCVLGFLLSRNILIYLMTTFSAAKNRSLSRKE